MRSKGDVLISLVSREPISEETGRLILDLFYNHYPMLTPQYADYVEPINEPIPTVEEALKYWEGEGFYTRRSSLKGFSHPGTDIEKISHYKFKYTWHKKVEWFQLFKELINLSHAYFGYVHLTTERESEAAEIGSAVDCFLGGTRGMYLKKGIPQLGWGTYFGEEYIKELDVPLLEKHGVSVEPWGQGYIFTVTDSIADVINDYDAFHVRRKEVKKLFRPDLFQKYDRYNRTPSAWDKFRTPPPPFVEEDED